MSKRGATKYTMNTISPKNKQAKKKREFKKQPPSI